VRPEPGSSAIQQNPGIPSCRWFKNNDNRSNTLSGVSNWLSEFQHVVDSETTAPGKYVQTPSPGCQIGCQNFSMSLIQKRRLPEKVQTPSPGSKFWCPNFSVSLIQKRRQQVKHPFRGYQIGWTRSRRCFWIDDLLEFGQPNLGVIQNKYTGRRFWIDDLPESRQPNLGSHESEIKVRVAQIMAEDLLVFLEQV
jgi:hypothetical protein